MTCLIVISILIQQMEPMPAMQPGAGGICIEIYAFASHGLVSAQWTTVAGLVTTAVTKYLTQAN